MTVHLTKAPIIEALVDIQCEWGTDIPPDAAIKKLDGLVRAIKGDFSKIENRLEQQIEVKPPGQPVFSSRHDGFILRSDKDAIVVQLRRGGFTYSKLAPYQTWENLRDGAKRYWDLYCTTVGPATVKRVATRYINKIQLPYPLTGNEDHLIGIKKPLTRPSEFSNLLEFTERHVSLDATSGATVILTKATQPRAPGATHVDVAIDIDVFRDVVDLNATDGTVWDIINSFQEVKNRLFFAVIGPSTIEKYR